jgi:hypothetical protein
MRKITITEIERTEMINIDLSNKIKYSAIINGNCRVLYDTDGWSRKHLSLEEWTQLAEEIAHENLKTLEQ